MFSVEQITCDDINCGPKQVCLIDWLTHTPRCTSCRYKCSRKRRPSVCYVSLMIDKNPLQIDTNALSKYIFLKHIFIFMIALLCHDLFHFTVSSF